MSTMSVGMLWFDGDKKEPLHARIQKAANFYREKYGDRPNLCFVHPRMLSGTEGETGPELKLFASESVLPDHFWLGIEPSA